MRPNDIKFNDKIKAIINDRSKVLFAEGTMNSSKSFPMGIGFLFRIMEMPQNANIFVIAGKSKSWLERYISDPSSFVNLFPNVCTYKGGSNAHVEVKSRTGTKRIYLAGYDNKTTWGQVLGLNIRGFLIEEINIAHIDFVRQCFGRISRFEDAFIMCNSNGGFPDLEVYTEYLDRCTPHPDFIQDIPETTLDILNKNDRRREDYTYIFSTFFDNPIVTEKTINEMLSIHPPGSYSYQVYIQGMRANVEGALYAHLINDLYVNGEDFKGSNIKYSEINHHQFKKVYVGIDLGSNVTIGNKSDNNAKTVFVIVGLTDKSQRVVVIDAYEVKGDINYTEIIRQFNEWIKPYYSLYHKKIQSVRPDAADPLFIKELRTNIVVPIEVIKSIKDEIPKRIAMKQQLLYQHRLLFSDLPYAQKCKNMLKKIVSDGKDKYIDDNKEWNDYQDALDYALTPQMHELMNFKLS